MQDMATHYPSNLKKVEWKALKAFLPPRPKHPRLRWGWKTILNGIFYFLKTGCQWRFLPSDFPPWQTVYYYFRLWNKSGFWETVNEKIRNAVRLKMGKKAQPSASITDSQSVKTASWRKYGTWRACAAGLSELVGFDGNKKVKGIKRQILVDTNGFLVKVKVFAANENDGVIAQDMFHDMEKPDLEGMQVVWADEGYENSDLDILLLGKFGIRLEIVASVKEQENPKGFKVQPKRWIVERTLAWFGNYRRLSKDYERLVETSESIIYASMTRLMLARL
jgi:putative transposase